MDLLLTGEEISEALDARAGTEHERFVFVARAQLKKDSRAIHKMRGALEALLEHYLRLANSGDAGFWNPEEEDVVISARQALLRASKHSL